MIKLRSLPLYVTLCTPLCVALCILSSGFVFPAVAQGQGVAPTVRIVDRIDEAQLVTLNGNTNPHANAKNDRGAVSSDFSMPDLTLVLSRSPEQQAAFDAFGASQYDPGSPNYRQWLTPQQIGQQYGPAPADIATIIGWLSSHGFAIKSVAPDRMTIRFSGTAGLVQSAFHTEIHNLSVNGASHIGNMSDPQIPAALSPVVVGVKALHNFLPHPLHRMGAQVRFNRQLGRWQRLATSTTPNSTQASPGSPSTALGSASPQALHPHLLFGINGEAGTDNAYLEEDVTPWDFATIYDVTPAWTNGYTGSGQTIAIAGTSLIAQSSVGSTSYPGPGTVRSGSGNDVATFRSAFDIPALTSFEQIDTGDGPIATVCTSTSPYAACGIGDLEENSLDVEWSGAVAKGASLVLVVTGQNSNGSVDTVYDSAYYVVQNDLAKILSLSYGECELGQGTAENVAFYDLWESAKTEGISVFVAAGDSGSPSCDDDEDESYGNPYIAQYGLSVSGIASTPYNTAVGGTDFSWCQPYYNSSGDFEGCPTSSSGVNTAYWNTSNNSTTGASAANYVPEIPWNDTCENPIQAKYLETLFSAFLGVSSVTTPEQACSYVYKNWYQIDSYFYDNYEGYNPSVEYFVDTVGGSGGASNCVVNSTNPDSTTTGACSTGANTTGTANGSIPLTNDGWQSPAWQYQSGVTGTSSLTTRALPDVSFFAGDGSLDSATLICVSALGPCTYPSSTSSSNQDDELEEQEVGGTSVSTPEMAGVMALINQKAGSAQGLANPELYALAALQSYSECSAESVTNSSNCYFQSIDEGTNTMPCNLNGSSEGGDDGGPYIGTASPNCTAINSGDAVGTLVSSGTIPAYNAVAGYNMATGLGSLNVWNVVHNWVSDVGTASSTMTVQLSPTGSISANTQLTINVTMAGSGSLGTPTGSIAVTGGGYSGSQVLSGGAAQIIIPASSLAPGSVTLTVTYSGDGNYASQSKTETVTVTAVNPTVLVLAPSSGNIANAVNASVTVSGPVGAPTPTGTVTLTGGSYSSTAVTLSSAGVANFVIPAGDLPVGSDTLTANYSGSTSYYAGATGNATILIVSTALLNPTITVTPNPTSIDSSQSLSVTVLVKGSGATAPSGYVTLTATGGYSSGLTVLSGGSATIIIPGNTLGAGTVTLTATYSGDAGYGVGTPGTNTVTVTESSFTLTPGAPSSPSVTPGQSATVTVTAAPTAGYTGILTLTCAQTSTTAASGGDNTACNPSGSDQINLATCGASCSVTFTIGTYAPEAAALVRPKLPGGGNKGLLGAGSGAVLALLVFFGIPARRRSWRNMLSILVALVAIGALASCGGGGSSGGGGGGGQSDPGTLAGTYTYTVTVSATPSVTPPVTQTFKVIVN